MGLLAKLFLRFARTRQKIDIDKRSKYIFYKIVDVCEKYEKYTLQCINTSAIFYLKITDFAFDIDILHALHPIQACYIGMQYARFLQKTNLSSTLQAKQNQKLKHYAVSRYGNYNLCYQDRNGNICFIKQNTNEEFLMDPCDVVFSIDLIQEFDAAQAFYIGLLAGLKLNSSNKNKYRTTIHSHLWLVK